MDNKKSIDQLIEAALNSADGAARATPAPWLLTRIQARLSQKQQSAWDKISVFISRPAFAIPALAIVLTVNIAAVVFTSPVSRSTMEQTSGDTADDLQYNNGSFYDIVNASPQ